MVDLPRFILGHNSLIGVNHVARAQGRRKLSLADDDKRFLDEAAAFGVRGVVLDNHPVALEAARHLAEHQPRVRVCPMVPYAQAVVDEASSAGLAGVATRLASSGAASPGRIARLVKGGLAQGLKGVGSRAAVNSYLADFPDNRGPVAFLHNAVTDLLVAWRLERTIAAFAAAFRDQGFAPGFVTLNPGSIPLLSRAAGPDAWFMAAVNSAGMQMSPSRERSEEVLADPSINVVAMSVLGGGLLKAEHEIPRALSFPAVRSVVIGTSKTKHLRVALDAVASASVPEATR